VSLEKIEEEHIRRVLASAKSLQEAAEVLGIDQATPLAPPETVRHLTHLSLPLHSAISSLDFLCKKQHAGEPQDQVIQRFRQVA